MRSRLTRAVIPVIGLLAVTGALALVATAPVVLFSPSNEAGPLPSAPAASSEVATRDRAELPSSAAGEPSAREQDAGGSGTNFHERAACDDLSRRWSRRSHARQDGAAPVRAPRRPRGRRAGRAGAIPARPVAIATDKGNGWAKGHCKPKHHGKAKGHSK